jgi:hypothetical protein
VRRVRVLAQAADPKGWGKGRGTRNRTWTHRLETAGHQHPRKPQACRCFYGISNNAYMLSQKFEFQYILSIAKRRISLRKGARGGREVGLKTEQMPPRS